MIIVSNRCIPYLQSLMTCFSVTGAFPPPGTGIYVLIQFQDLGQKSQEWSNEITAGPCSLNFQLLLVIINKYM